MTRGEPSVIDELKRPFSPYERLLMRLSLGGIVPLAIVIAIVASR